MDLPKTEEEIDELRLYKVENGYILTAQGNITYVAKGLDEALEMARDIFEPKKPH